MRARIFKLDAFTTQRFRGNPAAVVLLPSFPDESLMQMVAAENMLPETAFLVPENSDYRLRWFTPVTEVPLCGHATLASAAVVMERLETDRKQVVFGSASGPLQVNKTAAGYTMDFPARFSDRVSLPQILAEAIGAVPVEVYANEYNYLAVLESEDVVRRLVPDMALISRLDRSGLIVTAAGSNGYDFVSRYFAPAKGIPEDPVTGGAHCMLAPYWAKQLGKTEFRAFQASARGGEMLCRLRGNRVELEGNCVFYLEGEIDF